MNKLSKKDQDLWSFYTSNIKFIGKKKPYSYISDLKKSYKYKKLKKNENFKIENKIIKNLKNNIQQVDATLDLHGLSAIQAKKKLNNFVEDCYWNNFKNIVVITGKGQNNKGVLKINVPYWLSDQMISKFIVGFNPMPEKKGGQGALFIRLKNKNKYKNE